MLKSGDLYHIETFFCILQRVPCLQMLVVFHLANKNTCCLPDTTCLYLCRKVVVPEKFDFHQSFNLWILKFVITNSLEANSGASIDNKYLVYCIMEYLDISATVLAA